MIRLDLTRPATSHAITASTTQSSSSNGIVQTPLQLETRFGKKKLDYSISRGLGVLHVNSQNDPSLTSSVLSPTWECGA